MESNKLLGGSLLALGAGAIGYASWRAWQQRTRTLVVAPSGQIPGALHVEFGDYSYPLRVRHGHGSPTHEGLRELIEQGRASYLEALTRWQRYSDKLRAIPNNDPGDGRTPCWGNTWFTDLDAISLYCTLAEQNPARYVEVGSGNSTRFARRAIEDNGLRTQIVSIDPSPRADVLPIVDHPVRARLEELDPRVFSTLSADDLVLIDNSHRSLQNSDVTVCFLELLPRLPRGTRVHLHDVFLPDDYPEHWLIRMYNEQYLLGTALLFGSDKLRVEFPAHFAARDPQLAQAASELLGRPLGSSGSFWFTIQT